MTSSIKYENGKVYKIVCRKTGLIYVGSTTKPLLCQRLTAHRTHYKMYLDGRHNFVTSFKLLENDDYYIELLENVKAKSKDELLKRERYYIETLNCVNVKTPTHTRQEYKDKNRDEINRKIREYYKNHQEHYKEQKKEYRKNNKETIKEKRAQMHKCLTCNCEFQIKNIPRHERTKKHLQLLEAQI